MGGRQADLCEFKASLGYRASARTGSKVSKKKKERKKGREEEKKRIKEEEKEAPS